MNVHQTDRATPSDLVLGFLEQHHAMTVAAADPKGVPWATPVFYVNEGFRLYWISNSHGRLGAYLGANPRAAVTILDASSGWQRMQGLQVEGGVRLINSWREYIRCARLYLRKFPGRGRDLFNSRTGRHFVQNGPGIRFYQLEVERCWFTDHSKGLGSRVEMDLRRQVSPVGKACTENVQC